MISSIARLERWLCQALSKNHWLIILFWEKYAKPLVTGLSTFFFRYFSHGPGPSWIARVLSFLMRCVSIVSRDGVEGVKLARHPGGLLHRSKYFLVLVVTFSTINGGFPL